MERAVERALSALAAWLAADAAGCRLAAGAANLQWRASLLAAAAGAPSSPRAAAASRLPGALRAFPSLCPRLQRVHLREAARSAAGLHTTVLPLLHDALAGFARAAGEAWALACAGGGGGGGGAGEDAAALLAQLRQALAARTCARVRWAAALAAADDGGGGSDGEGGGGGAAALAAQAEAWGEVARQWEAGALLLAEEFAELEAGVWRATAGGASLRALCSGQEQQQEG
jgi:hypothetical protein